MPFIHGKQLFLLFHINFAKRSDSPPSTELWPLRWSSIVLESNVYGGFCFVFLFVSFLLLLFFVIPRFGHSWTAATSFASTVCMYCGRMLTTGDPAWLKNIAKSH